VTTLETVRFALRRLRLEVKLKFAIKVALTRLAAPAEA
jgi:hypothetical protein